MLHLRVLMQKNSFSSKIIDSFFYNAAPIERDLSIYSQCFSRAARTCFFRDCYRGVLVWLVSETQSNLSKNGERDFQGSLKVEKFFQT